MTTPQREVRQATVADLDLLVPLFDAYRQFYRQPSHPGQARQFLRERFEHDQSVIFLAFADGAAVGFSQLYPSFSSGAMAENFYSERSVRGPGSASVRGWIGPT
jgi:hypothetical protein